MRRRTLEREEEEVAKEWRLIDEITVNENDKNYKINNLNLEEILVETIGLTNITETNSGIKIKINDSCVVNLDSQKATGASDVRYQKAHLKFNGLFWESAVTPACNNEEGYFSSFTNLLSSYSVKKDIGKCEKISIDVNNISYALKSGTIRIYGR